MNPAGDRQDAFDAWWAEYRPFLDRKFPTECARIINGVGLASLTTRAQLVFSQLEGHWNPRYLRITGASESTQADLHEIHQLLGRAIPAIPPDSRAYFEDLRFHVSRAIALTDRWWNGDPTESRAGS